MLSTPTKSHPTNSTRSTNSSCCSSQPFFFLLSSPAVSRANSAASKSEPNLSLQHPILVPREALSPSYFLPDSTLRAALLFHIFEFLYLQYEDEEKPIYLYINSTGTTKVMKN
ncbi:hypothetical protein Ancab_015585 [Ancistrocladus abbreviatus]